MTSHNTFEHEFRRRLLDIVYAQWSALGLNFAEGFDDADTDVIDIESLLFCSLEFLPTEPRLAEGVIDWFAANHQYVLRQRIKRMAGNDPRSGLWDALDKISGTAIADIADPYRKYAERLRNRLALGRTGKPRPGPTTLLLRARDLLGHDVRHVLLVFLLANPQGGRLRDAAAWSGYTYRSLSHAASRWEEVGIIQVNSGTCRPRKLTPFRELLVPGTPRLVRWQPFFSSAVAFLRDLATLASKGLPDTGPVAIGLRRAAFEAMSAAVDEGGQSSAVRAVLETQNLPI